MTRRLLPPILADALRSVRDAAGDAEYELAPEGFRSSGSGKRGWDVESVARAQKEAWPRFLESIGGSGPLGVSHEAIDASKGDIAAHNVIMSFGYVLALASRRLERMSLLDWGGGLGQYYPLARVLSPEVEIEYHCRDLPLLCREGRLLNPDATFHTEDETCLRRGYDLVLASSSLQYSEDWRGTVARLAAAAKPYLFVTRMPIVHREPSFVVIQRAYRYGYDTEYPGWFLNRGEFLDHLRSLGMKLVREFLIQEIPVVHRAPERGEQRGFLFRPDSDRSAIGPEESS